MNEFTTISLYLKGVKKAIKFEVPNDLVDIKIDTLYKDLLIRDIIKFGPCIFQRSELLYIIVE